MKLFELFATLGLDTSGFDRGVQGAQGKMTSLASTAGKAVEGVGKGALSIGKAAANAAGSIIDTMENALKTIGTIGGGAMIALGMQAVSAAADIAAENAAFSATFGDMADEAKAAYAIIGEQANILDTRLQKTATKGFSQLKGAGMNANEALEASTRLLNLAADGAAYYDRSLEDTDERLRSFLRGNVEAGDSIGLFTSELQRNNKAIDLYGEKWDKLTESQRQMVMLNIAEEIYEQSGVIGQAARESEGWANVVGNLKEAWRQTLGVIGTPIMDALTPVIQGLTQYMVDHKGDLEGFAGQLGEIITLITTGKPEEAIAAASGMIDGFLKTINKGLEDGTLIAKGESIIDSLIAGFQSGIAEFSKTVRLIGLPIAMTVMELKGELLAAGIELIGAFAQSIADNPEDFTESVSGVVRRVATAVKTNAPKMIAGAGALITSLADGLTTEESLDLISGAIESLIGSVVAWIATPGNTAKLTEAFGQLIWAAIEGAFNAIKENPMGIAYGLLSPFATVLDAITGGILDLQGHLDSAYATWQAMNGEGEIVGTGLAEQIGETAGAAESLDEAMGNASTTFEQAGEEFGGATGTFEEASTILGTVEESAEGVTSSAKEAAKALRNIVPHGIDTSGITSAASDIVKSIGGITSAAVAAANALAFMSRYTTDIPLGGIDNDIGKHAATGLERVPYDGFPAILHKDEMVLDRKDANAYRNGDAPGQERGNVTVNQYISAVPQTPSELAFVTANALEMLRFNV